MDKEDVELSRAPLSQHLVELRQRLIVSLTITVIFFVICFIFADKIFNILVIPYQKGAGTENVRLIFTALQSYFFVQVKIAIFGALFITFPVIATQIYKFIAPGLYKSERKVFIPLLVATPVLFTLGASLVYFIIIPLATHFFLSQQQIGGNGFASIENLQDVSSYLDFIMKLIFAFGIMFQLPVIITLMAKVDLVSSTWLKNKRKYAILLIFIIAAILTPPDPISQIGLAIPALFLYELSILLVLSVEKYRR